MALKPPEVPTYGVRHVMEEEMREAGDGVYEASSNERRRKTARTETKNEGAAPANKSAGAKVISAETVPASKTPARRAAKRK